MPQELFISENEQKTEKRETPVFRRIDTLVKNSHEFLTENPTRSYFDLPGETQEFKTQFSTLDSQEVKEMSKLLVVDNVIEEMKERYSPRAVGLFLKTLGSTQGDGIVLGLKEVVPHSFNSEQETCWNKIYQIALTSPDPDYLSSQLGDQMTNIFYDRVTQDRVMVNGSLELLRMGIVKKENGEILDEARFVFQRGDKYNLSNKTSESDLPWLKELFANPQILVMEDDNVQEFTAYSILNCQLKSHDELSSFIIDYLDHQSSPERDLKANSLLSISILQNNGEILDEIKPFIKDDFVMDSGTGYETLEQMVNKGIWIKESSYFDRQLTKIDINANQAAKLVGVILDRNSGKWENLDPILKKYLEDKILTGDIEMKCLVPIISSCVGFGNDLPEFLSNYFSTPSHSNILSEWDFSFSRWQERNKDGVNPDYPINPRVAFFSKGIEVLPKSLRPHFSELFKNANPDTLGVKLLNALYSNNGYFDKCFSEGLHFDNYKDEIYKAVHPVFWDVVKQLSPKVITEYMKGNQSLTHLGVTLFRYDSQGVFQYTPVDFDKTLDPTVLEQWFSALTSGRDKNLDFSLLALLSPLLDESRIATYLPETQKFLSKYLEFTKTSRKEEYRISIENPTTFWANHGEKLWKLLEAGFDVNDFDIFLRVVRNTNSGDLLGSSSILSEGLYDLRTKIGLSLDNIGYLKTVTVFDLLHELKQDDKAKFYRQILAESPRSFANTVEAISQLKTKRIDIDITQPETQKDIKEAITKLGNISPLALARYVQEKDPVKRVEFLQQVQEVKEKLLLNSPVFEITSQEDGDKLLAEFIVLSYPGTELSDVISLLETVRDRCDDIKDLKIRAEGYDASVNTVRLIPYLKDGVQFDNAKIARIAEN